MKKTYLKRISAKKKIKLTNLSAIKKSFTTEHKNCIFCHCEKNLDLMHIIRRSYSEELYDDPRNIVPACRICHKIFDDGKNLTQLYPNLTKVLAIMKELDELYYNRFISKRII